MFGFPYFEGLPIANTTIGCAHYGCQAVALMSCAKTSDECNYRFCANHASHAHHRCCIVDNGVTCTNLATHLSDQRDPVCSVHLYSYVYSKCQKCGRRQEPPRREYVYCIPCRDANIKASELHQFTQRYQHYHGKPSAYGPGSNNNACVIA